MCRKKNDTDPVLQAVLIDKNLQQPIESIRSKKGPSVVNKLCSGHNSSPVTLF